MDKFGQEYRKAMDAVHPSDELRNNIMNLKPARRTITPFKATLASVAAAVMIVVVAHDYDFKPEPEGVISEKVVATQAPETAFHGVATETEKPVIAKATPKPQTVEEKPQVKVEEPVVQTETEPQPQAEVAPVEQSEGAPMMARNGGSGNATIQVWEINRYFEYIGGNPANKISAVVPVDYTGVESFEFLVEDNGELVHDVVTLDYAGGDKSLSLTVSKKPMFDISQSGVVSAADNGFVAYKVSGDVYYYIFANGVTEEEITAIVNVL